MQRLFLLLFLASALHPLSQDQAGASYLLDDLPKSVRAMGMGNVVAAPGTCAYSGNYEPGLFPGNERLSFMSFHAGLPFGDQVFCLGTGMDFGPRSGARLVWSQITSRNVEKTGIDSITAADTLAYHVEGDMGSYENLFSGVLGFSPFPGLNAGIAAKYYYNLMDNIIGSGFGLDAGLSWQGLPGNLGSGILVKNLLMPRIRFNRELGMETLPASIRLGCSYTPFNGRGGLYADVYRILETGYAAEYSLGIEFKPVPVLSLRAGYGEFNLKEGGAVCLGAGLFVKGIFFDYAFSGRSDLGFAGGHRLGIGYRLDYGE